jgi:histidine decarboxylase
MPADPAAGGDLVTAPARLGAVTTATATDSLLRELLATVAGRIWPGQDVIGFPHATDLDFGPIAPLAAGGLNNIGDPIVPGLEQRNVKDLEREVVQLLADLFRVPRTDRWGCVTTGGTEGNLHGLLQARTVLHDPAAPTAPPVVLASSAAHYSIPKACHLLGLDLVTVPTTVGEESGGGSDGRPGGEMDYAELAAAVYAHMHRPIAVVVTAGTTMTEAVDSVAEVTRVFDHLGIRRASSRRYIHVDAALSGIPLALDTSGARHPSVNMALGHIDSLTISGHKFLGTPEPCGVLLTRRRHRDQLARAVSYIGGVDATIAGSRSGHTVLQLWWALHSIGGLAAHRHRAERARAVATYTTDRLAGIGWPAWRHEHAFTVVIAAPPAPLIQRWSLATADGHSHIVCVPGVTTEIIDRFVDDLAAAR